MLARLSLLPKFMCFTFCRRMGHRQLLGSLTQTWVWALFSSYILFWVRAGVHLVFCCCCCISHIQLTTSPPLCHFYSYPPSPSRIFLFWMHMVRIALLYWVIVLLTPFIRENSDHKPCSDECSVFLAVQSQVIARTFPYPTKREIRVEFSTWAIISRRVQCFSTMAWSLSSQFSFQDAVWRTNMFKLSFSLYSSIHQEPPPPNSRRRAAATPECHQK